MKWKWPRELKSEKVGLLVSGGLLIAILIVGFKVSGRVPAKLPLFFSQPWGSGQLADQSTFLFMWLATLTGLAVNTFVAIKASVEDMLLARLFAWTGIVLSGLMVIGMTKIWLLFL